MGRRGQGKHMKRINAPKHLMLDKLSGIFVSLMRDGGGGAAEAAEGGEAEEGGQREVGAEAGVGRDVGVAGDDRDEGDGADELGGVERGAPVQNIRRSGCSG